jgi:CubicO group peptidase (beta-lactamase class C family)
MSKMFTAVAVMQLVQNKKIKLSDRVKPLLAKYKSLPSDIEGVTIEDLLMNVYPGGKYAIKDFQHTPPLNSPVDYLSFYENVDLLFPSEEFNDSHFNFILLGLVIEAVSKQDYYTYIKEKIYTPAGMTFSDSYSKESLPGGTAVDPPNLKYLPSRGSPAGGSYSTVIDLFNFALALMQGKLLDKKHLPLLISSLNLKDQRFYGYGFEVSLAEPRWIGQDVQCLGVSASLRMYPDSSHVSVVLSNVKNTARKVADLIRKHLQIRED